MSEADVLLALQECDLQILRANKKLDELSEKQEIIDTRAKRNDVLKKRAQVVDMKDDIDMKLQALQTEDDDLKEKSAIKQANLDESSDYRAIANIKRDLEGLVKRREKIEFESHALYERDDKINAVMKQLNDALFALDKREELLIASYRKKGHAIQKEIAILEQERDDAATSLTSEILEQYEQLRATKNGIGAAQIENMTCSVCRVAYHEGQIAQLKRGPEITICPSCKRLLVVPKD